MSDSPIKLTNGFRRFAILAVYLMLLSIVITIAVLDIQREQNQILRQDIDKHLQRDFSMVASMIRPHIQRNDIGGVVMMMDSWLNSREDILSYTLLDQHETPVFIHNKPLSNIENSQGLLSLAQDIHIDEQLVYHANLKIDPQHNRQEIIWVAERLIGILIFILLVSGIVVWLALRRLAFRPMEEEIERRKKVEQELRESELRQRAVLDNMVHGVITISDKGVIKDYNKSVTSMFGYDKTELLGLAINNLMPQSFAERHDQYLENYLQTGNRKIIGIGREVPCVRKDGTVFPAELSVSEVVLENGQRFFTGIIRDITSYKQSEADLVRAKEQAEIANKEKTRFLSRMSHELRTPLNAILGFAQLMENDSSELQNKANVQHILKSGWHLLELINEVLDLSRIETGKLEISLSNVAVEEVIQECVELLKPMADEYQITIELQQHERDVGYVRADRKRLKQIIINILSNGIKYNHRGGHVRLTYRLIDDRRLRISIEDDGPGLSQSSLVKLFEPFNRLGAEKTQVEGTGIGLVITKYLVEHMGGRIGVMSKEGQGSTFWFELKVAADKSDNTASAEVLAPEKTRTPADKTDAKTKVLYVEDNPVNLTLVQGIFKKRDNIELLAAEDGKSGIALALSANPDIILLDINLPDMDGFEVLKTLREHEIMANIPIMALSANAMADDIEHAETLGFDYYFVKPLDIMLFLDIMDKTIASLRD